jgi:hypothetical protein
MSLEFLWKVTMLCLVFVAFNHMGGLMFIFIGRENSALIEPYGPVRVLTHEHYCFEV